MAARFERCVCLAKNTSSMWSFSPHQNRELMVACKKRVMSVLLMYYMGLLVPGTTNVLFKRHATSSFLLVC
jgi:hypothetical protein